MAEDLLPILAKFHRDVLLPDMQRLIAEFRQEMNGRFNEVNGHLDTICQRLDRLATGALPSLEAGTAAAQRTLPANRCAFPDPLRPRSR